MNIQVIAQNVQLDDVAQVVEIDLRERKFITENTDDHLSCTRNVTDTGKRVSEK